MPDRRSIVVRVRPLGADWDEGVSAYGQVCITLNVRSSGKEDELDYAHMLNRVLPDDIIVLGWSPAPSDDFSARFAASHRTYRYFFVRRSLDAGKLLEAGRKLVGEHDFRNFCKMDVMAVSHFRRRIAHFDVVRASKGDAPDRDVMYFEIRGNAFLWHQVRAIAAVLFSVASGHEAPSLVDDLLDVNAVNARPPYKFASDLPLLLHESAYEEGRSRLGTAARRSRR